MRHLVGLALSVLGCLAGAPHVEAQEPRSTMAPRGAQSPFLGSVPATSDAVEPSLTLSLRDVLQRGLQHNLGVLLEEQRVRQAEGTRWRLLSGLLPDVSGVIRQTREKVNLAAFGFTGFPGIPNLVGPFNVFDARVAVSQPVLDLSAVYEAKHGAAQLRAEEHSYEEARRVVLLVVTNLYLQAVAGDSRLAAARVQAETAESLYRLAVDQNAAGVVPRLDVLRADVERKAAAQRLHKILICLIGAAGAILEDVTWRTLQA